MKVCHTFKVWHTCPASLNKYLSTKIWKPHSQLYYLSILILLSLYGLFSSLSRRFFCRSTNERHPSLVVAATIFFLLLAGQVFYVKKEQAAKFFGSSDFFIFSFLIRPFNQSLYAHQHLPCSAYRRDNFFISL